MKIKFKYLKVLFLYGKHWIEEVKFFSHLNSRDFLDKLVSLYVKYKDVSLLRYGLKILNLHDINPNDWKTLESKIISLWVRLPSLSDLIINMFWENKSNLNKINLKNALYSVLERGLRLGHQQEVIWCIWFVKVFDISLRNEFVLKILKSDNSLAVIIMLDIIYARSLNSKMQINLAIKALEKEKLLEENGLLWGKDWLLLYESKLNGWFVSDEDVFFRNNQFFKLLHKNKISFYNKDFSYNDEKQEHIDHNIYIRKKDFKIYVNKIQEMLININSNLDNVLDDYIADIEEMQDEFFDEYENEIDIY